MRDANSHEQHFQKDLFGASRVVEHCFRLLEHLQSEKLRRGNVEVVRAAPIRDVARPAAC